jgi:hypothetical protein
MIDTSIQRVKISQVIENQLPEFVQADNPLFVEFMKQYYVSQEYQGGTVDIGENIDQYTKLQTYVGSATTVYTGLSTDTQSYSTTIYVDNTRGWPEKYGLLKIDDEIVTYTGIGSTYFSGCVRGFSGVDALERSTRPDLLSFSSTVGAAHTGGTKVYNLSNLFLQEFFNNLKSTFANGFQNRSLYGDVNQVQFIRQVKDFFKTKGTEESYKILFKVLYNQNVNVLKPSQFLFKPSDADYSITQDFVVKSISGDPRALKGSTLFQDKDENDVNIVGASGAISDVKDFVYGGEHYYQVSISKDSIFGDFIIPGRTRLTDNVSVGATVITVDSTVGFPTSGTLHLVNKDNIVGIVTYNDKTLNQFLGISTIPKSYSVSDEIRYGNVAYGYTAASLDRKIEVLITGVLSRFRIPNDTIYFNKGDTIKVGSLGIKKSVEDVKFSSWMHNVVVTHAPIVFEQTSTTGVYNVTTTSPHDLFEQDFIEVLDGDSNVLGTGRITNIISSSTFVLSDLPGIDPLDVEFIRRKLNRGNSTVHDNITKYTTDVQNTYDHESNNPEAKPPHPHVYVASPSIPSLGQQPISAPDRSIEWSGTTVGTTIQVTSGAKDHGFFSGEVVRFNVIVSTGSLGSLINGKNYFVSRENSNEIKLANSLPDLLNGTFVDATGSGTFKISVPDLANKKLEHQKLLKRISLNPLFDGREHETIPGTTGVLVNGTEILNYKSGDVVFFGGIDKVDVLSGGSNYDVITPPKVIIESTIGLGASATANLRGSFTRMDIVDPGFDYVDTPVIEITGGNGKNATAQAILKQVDHFIDFDASATGGRINITDNTIGFTTYHKFRDGEPVIYKAFTGTGAIGIASNSTVVGIQTTPDQNLINNEVYYVARIDSSTIKLANDRDSALTKSNLINITAFADGIQRFESLEKKKVIGQIVIENPGEGYENKRRLIPSTGINTYSDYIEYQNHGFGDGEVVRYTNSGIPIGGLQTTQDYYVLRVDNDRFRLAAAGIGTTLSNANYLTQQYVGLTSLGSGDHIFNYPPITVNVKGTIGINTASPENYHAVVNLVVRGSITSINVEKSGIGYGSSTIFNFAIRPTVRVSSGSSSEYKAIVNGGKIQSVIVTKPGTEYSSPPDLTIFGDGVGAKVIASISNGQVSKITVLNGGVGYTTSSVVVSENIPGSGVKFLPKITSWNINDVKRHEDIITEDDGFLTRGDNDNGIKFTSFYAPRQLRRILKQKNSDGTFDYAQNDLTLVNNSEQVSGKHSPIIGWAYDGNPIYGPYGYDRKDGGLSRIMRSGYTLKTSRTDGPPIDLFPLGFFIEDYEYNANGDLDRNNGRFCITPDYPTGTYAYFATIDPNSNQTSGTFKNYRAPQFPYLIGDKFTAKPDDYNFVETNNQDADLNATTLRRNTYPYKLGFAGATYDGIYDSTKLVDQESVVDYSSPGDIRSYLIENPGSDYKVNDKLLTKQSGSGTGFDAKVSSVVGKEIVSIASTIVRVDNVVFDYNNRNGNVTGFATQPHGLAVGDIINVSGLSTDALKRIGGRHRIGFNTSFLILNTGIGTTGATGIVTNLSVSGNLTRLNIEPNDIIGISTEQMLVLNIDTLNNKIRVKREYDGVIGTDHSGTSLITVLNRVIQFNIGISTNFITNRNVPYYFNPSETLALGSTAGVGIGSTITYSYKVVGGGSTSRFIPTQTAYLPDHGFVTGQELLYSNGDDTSIQVYNGISTFTLSNNSVVYAINAGKDFLGISTNPVAIGSTGSVVGIASTAYRLFFTGYGSGKVHSFEPRKLEVTGFIEKVVGTIVCKEPHGLLQKDRIQVSLTPGISTTYYVEYNETSKRTLISPRSFGSAGINTDLSLITISNHKYETGDKILYTSTNPAVPLVNNQTYFVVRKDKDSFKLAETYYKATKFIPEIIGITSTGSSHEIGLINPKLQLIRGYRVGFAVSDSSLGQTVLGKRTSSFDFNIYRDQTFIKPYYSNIEDNGFQVVGVGTVGVTTTASVDLLLTDNTPQQLFYKLTPVNLDVISEDKKTPVIDTDVINYSSLNVFDSAYNGTFNITGIGSTTFSFNLPIEPEKDSYTVNEATTLKYSTIAKQVSGPIDKVQIISKGKGYDTIPVVTAIASTEGVGGIVKLVSDNIGILRNYTIKNIGFDYPVDRTLQPSVQLPQILKLDRLSTISNIGITSGGKNYVEPPKVVVIDRVTGLVNQNVITDVELQGTSVSKVEILRNTNDLYDTNPRVITTNNSNGVKVSNVSYVNATNIVTLTLEGTFTNQTYPFIIGRKIFVENIGIDSTGSGYNSSDYDYGYFTITGVNTNPGGGNATVSYKLDSTVTNPGIFSGSSSSGRVVPFEDLPVFNVRIQPNQFSVGEIVSTGDKFGTVVSWNEVNKYLKVISSNDVFKVDERINGVSSKSIALIREVIKFDSYFEVDSNSTVKNGWQRDTGKPSESLQKISDNDYYQVFSYSLESPIEYEKWRDPVSSLSHVVGFKKFSDLQVVSIASTDAKNRRTAAVGVSSQVTSTLVDMVSENESVFNKYDFDLVTENSKLIDSVLASDEIKFGNRILTDYIESRTNRAISIDSVSSQFNDQPRSTTYSEISNFDITEIRSAKFYILIFDRRFSGEKEIIEVNVVHNGSNAYIVPFGRVETQIDLGTFDFVISGATGLLRFVPAKFKANNYALRILSQQTFIDTKSGIGSTEIGTGYKIISSSAGISSSVSPVPFQVVGFGTTSFTTTKLFVETTETTGEQRSQINELIVLQDGTEAYLLEYGQTIADNISATSVPSVGLGTFGADVKAGITSVYFTPVAGVGVTMRIHQTSIDSSATGIGSTTIALSQILTTTTSIGSTTSPQATRISGFSSSVYQSANCLIEINDTTNNRYEVTQVTMIHDGTEIYFNEYGSFNNFGGSGIGTIGVGYSATGPDVELLLTPPSNTNITTKVLQYNLTETGGTTGIVSFTNSRIKSEDSFYTGTENDITFSFNLKHRGDSVFHKVFDASNPAVVDVTNNLFIINNHFFTNGEKITYAPTGAGTTMSIGIGTTSIVGFGTTDKLPSTLYVVKIAENKFKVAASATDALLNVPNVIDITAVGVGTTHAFTSQKLNSKMLVTLDNNIQSPLIQSPINTGLSTAVSTGTDFITMAGISSFFSGDVIKINNEFMKIDTVGIGGSNIVLVKRAQLNSALENHGIGSTITKYVGNYQIVRDTINFVDAPKGEKGPVGLTTTSTFTARAFIRTGVSGSTEDTYTNNYVFDTVEDQFTGIATSFILKSEGSNVTGFATNTGVILVNEIFQNPKSPDDYILTETAGISSIRFTGAGVSVSYDVNVSSIPRGGIIVSVAETSSFGYQPLVDAGGTAIVSLGGTITSVSIGNSGSGYRVGVQTNILVKAISTSGIVTIGRANVTAGLVTSVTITNPGSGFTSTNPPTLEFDAPLNYENMRLVGSPTGVGASVSVRVGFAKSVISFDITNYGYNYKVGDVLELATDNQAGIPTDASVGVAFTSFRLTVTETFNDSFAGWTFGELEKLNTFEDLFDGERRTFNLTKTVGASETLLTLRAAKGSPIRVEDNLLIFLNDILQIPFESYVLIGGSQITFSEPPKFGDKLRIYFYRASDNDVTSVDILETVKPGDKLTINDYPDVGLDIEYQELSRTVTGITTADVVTTNTYIDVGITTDRSLQRPVTWKKQVSDLIIGNLNVTKDRPELEAGIRPVSYIINNVSVASTEVFVDTAVPFFNEIDDIAEVNQSVIILDRTEKTGVAATALVSAGGTISNIIISDGGSGFTTPPAVSIGVTAGIGTIYSGIGITMNTNATGVTVLSGLGTVSSVTIVNAGAGYTNTNPPIVMIEAEAQTTDKLTNIKYEGDFGIITGIGTTSVVGIATTGLTFDLFIPLDSPLRSSNTMTTPITASGIQTNYYFVVFDSNTGSGLNAYGDASGVTTVGIGTSFIDNIYKVMSVTNVTGDAVGVGTTTLTRVTVSVSSTTGVSVGSSVFYGRYSWGRLYDFVKSDASSFTAIHTDGVTGIITGPVIVRTKDLKEAYI